MLISESLWQTNQDLAKECLDHPFIQGIADGSLAKAKFAYYIGQDAFFLMAFARAYSIAAGKSEDLYGFEVFHALASGVLEELRLHQRYAVSWGIDLQKVTSDTATQRYTDFLLATAWGQEIGLTAVVMAPCMRLYAYLGQEIAKSGIPNHTYSDWIRAYSNSEFGELADRLEDLIERYAHPVPAVYSSYRYAMKCEREFFQSAWEVER
ncbi:MAG: TenA family protein [Leptolyngbyaceae cyanobacterium RU_5_1]|nr:TenA family protein [Leptolyngbyaceae cyanobacterium RU_5_1]